MCRRIPLSYNTLDKSLSFPMEQIHNAEVIVYFLESRSAQSASTSLKPTNECKMEQKALDALS